MRESSSISRDMLLISLDNYTYQKAHIKVFIMSSNEADSEAVEEGWTQPIVTADDGAMIASRCPCGP